MALRITYADTYTFQQLRKRDNSASIHYRDFQVLGTKMFTISSNF